MKSFFEFMLDTYAFGDLHLRFEILLLAVILSLTVLGATVFFVAVAIVRADLRHIVENERFHPENIDAMLRGIDNPILEIAVWACLYSCYFTPSFVKASGWRIVIPSFWQSYKAVYTAICNYKKPFRPYYEEHSDWSYAKEA